MYDYVIVGAGSAGCVLAARLSEDPSIRVAVVEAGPPDALDNIHVPAALGSLFRSQVDWDYATVPEDGCDHRRIYLPRGKTLGGSSSLNAMIYIRGHRADYDGWEAMGHTGWAYEDLLPYFKRSEDNERGASELHGAGGPLTVSENRSRNPMMSAFLAAAEEAGLPVNDDFNGREQDGFGYYQVTQRQGRRCSAAVAYLHPALERGNLSVESRMQAHRVLFEGGRAVGVVAERGGDWHELRAEREVILCAGTYNSPQLLMLSGVGPAMMLELLTLPVVVDLPEVGANLQDHPAVAPAWTTSEPVSLMTALTPENQALFLEEGRGPLTSNVGEAGGFVRTDEALPAPDIQYHAAPVLFVDDGLEPPAEHGMIIAPTLVAPSSRGSVRLASPDPTAKPIVQHNYYAELGDMAAMVAGVRTAIGIAAQPALRRYAERPFQLPASDGDEDVRGFIRRHTQTLYHPTSTCAMGAVVDDELRVHGVEALRVVDASVMPSVPRGNTNAPTIAIAEKASDLIRGLAPQQRQAAAAA